MSSEIKPVRFEQTLLWSYTDIYLFLCQSVVHAFDHGRWRVTGTGRGTTVNVLLKNIHSCFCVNGLWQCFSSGFASVLDQQYAKLCDIS